MGTPRGIRNNNPGNLRRYDDWHAWEGVSAIQDDEDFWKFDDAVMGMRALCKQLQAYQDRHGCHTVNQAIHRYAPPGDDNPTDAYADHVASRIGCGVDEVVDWHTYRDLRPALEAIIEQENGAPWDRWYTDDQLVRACALAGVKPQEKGRDG